MRIISAITLTIIALLLSISNTYAVRAYPFPIKITQPDGTELTIKLHGDEGFHYETTVDGYALTQNSSGVRTYARLDETHALKSTDIKASDIEKRSITEIEFVKTLTPNLTLQKQETATTASKVMRVAASSSNSSPQKAYPLNGSPKSLVILVNFSDKSFVTTSPANSFTNLLNQKGYSTNGGTGSAKDYFRDNSMGVFDPQFDVVGPFTLPQTMSYYGANDSSGDDTNPRQMVIDACTLASTNGVDFSQYDTDKDGIVDNVFIYYAGYNEAEGGPKNSVWPHRWSLSGLNTKFNGVSVYGYACTSELRSNSGSSMCGIGTFTHEFGHVLGLPDLYATVSTATQHTLSSWDIMDYGPYLNNGRTPCGYSSYERFFMKWLVPTELKSAQNVTLDTLSTSNKAYLITQNGNHNLNGAVPNPVEFFMLENRQNKGWDTYLPGHGMLITHIYYNSTTWSANTVNNVETTMGVDIVEADGTASDYNMSGDPFPGTLSTTSYSPTLRSGADIDKPIALIAETKGIITFHFINIPTIKTIGTLLAFSTVCGTPSTPQTITIKGTKLISPIQLNLNYGFNYEVKRETDNTWSKSLTLTPTDSTVNEKIQIRYNPTVPSYKDTHTDIINLKSKDAVSVMLNLYGKSTRPVYVTAPVAIDATDISLNSFVAHWKAVSDSTYKLAAGYYLTVYNLSDGSSEFKQGFKNGLTAPEGWTINATAISTSTVFSGDSIPAIQFQSSGEYVLTEKFLAPASGLSFFIKSLSEGSGKLLVEAWNGSQWTTIENVSIIASLSTTKTYSFDSGNNYIQFRFTFTRGSGYLIFDDISVKCDKQVEYNTQNKWITSNNDTICNDTVYNIIPGRDYYYKVKASDKTLYSDKTIKYENITDFSNIIQVKLSADSIIHFVNKNESLHVYKDNSGTVIVQIPSTDSVVRVYNAIGQLIQVIQPQALAVPIKNLRTGQFYIIQAGSNSVKTIIH